MSRAAGVSIGDFLLSPASAPASAHADAPALLRVPHNAINKSNKSTLGVHGVRRTHL